MRVCSDEAAVAGNRLALGGRVFDGVAAGDAFVTDGFSRRVEIPPPAGLGCFVRIPLQLLEFERLQLSTTGTLEMEHALVAGLVGAVHSVVFEVGSGDDEAAGIPESARALENRVERAGRVVANFVEEESANRFGLQFRGRSGADEVKRHRGKGEFEFGFSNLGGLDRTAVFEGRGDAISNEGFGLVFGSHDPHGRTGVFGDTPAREIEKGLCLGRLRRALDGNVAHTVVSETGAACGPLASISALIYETRNVSKTARF